MGRWFGRFREKPGRMRSSFQSIHSRGGNHWNMAGDAAKNGKGGGGVRRAQARIRSRSLGNPEATAGRTRSLPQRVGRAKPDEERCEPMRDQILSMKWQADWDGEGAKPITESVCRAAIRFGEGIRRESLRAPDSIAPSTQGAIG